MQEAAKKVISGGRGKAGGDAGGGEEGEWGR